MITSYWDRASAARLALAPHAQPVFDPMEFRSTKYLLLEDLKGKPL
jgi:hypothetical protein